MTIENWPITTRGKWTKEEQRFARKYWSQMTAAEIAECLGRTERAVFRFCRRVGLSEQRQPRPGLEKHIREQHKLGWSDREISDAWNQQHPELKVSREWVSEIRREKLQLPQNRFSTHIRQNVARKTAEQLRALGLKSLAEVKSKKYREFAARMGWPADLRPRAVQILNVLYEQGPQTRKQLAAAIGMPWKGSRKSLVSNDPEGSYLAHLIHRGLVISLGRLVKGKGSGSSTQLYALPPHITRKVPHDHAQKQQSDAASNRR